MICENAEVLLQGSGKPDSEWFYETEADRSPKPSIEEELNAHVRPKVANEAVNGARK